MRGSEITEETSCSLHFNQRSKPAKFKMRSMKNIPTTRRKRSVHFSRRIVEKVGSGTMPKAQERHADHQLFVYLEEKRNDHLLSFNRTSKSLGHRLPVTNKR